jgi:hypothetical protein
MTASREKYLRRSRALIRAPCATVNIYCMWLGGLELSLCVSTSDEQGVVDRRLGIAAESAARYSVLERRSDVMMTVTLLLSAEGCNKAGDVAAVVSDSCC